MYQTQGKHGSVRRGCLLDRSFCHFDDCWFVVLARCSGLLADACAATGTAVDCGSSSAVPPVVAAAGTDGANLKTFTATNSTSTTVIAPAASSALNSNCGSFQMVSLPISGPVFVELLLLVAGDVFATAFLVAMTVHQNGLEHGSCPPKSFSRVALVA